jgi:hypothetical protein
MFESSLSGPIEIARRFAVLRRYAAHTLLTQLPLQQLLLLLQPCPDLLLHWPAKGPVGQQMSLLEQQVPAQQVLPDPAIPHGVPVTAWQLPV